MFYAYDVCHLNVLWSFEYDSVYYVNKYKKSILTLGLSSKKAYIDFFSFDIFTKTTIEINALHQFQICSKYAKQLL